MIEQYLVIFSFLGSVLSVIRFLIGRYGWKLSEFQMDLVIYIAGPMFAVLYEVFLTKLFAENGFVSIGGWVRAIFVGITWAFIQLGAIKTAHSWTGTDQTAWLRNLRRDEQETQDELENGNEETEEDNAS